MFRIKQKVDNEARRTGLRINWSKIKILRINAQQQEKITIHEQEIEDVNEFTYLGAKVCKEGGGMEDIRNRLSKARGAYTKLIRI